MRTLTSEDYYFLEKGEHERLHEVLGAHIQYHNDRPCGTTFRVWAPNAKSVQVIGVFNNWEEGNYMHRLQSGLWELYIPHVEDYYEYKYLVEHHDGNKVAKADPFAFWSEVRPHTASRVYNLEGYDWQDQAWTTERGQKNFQQEPMLVYELHLGSWKTKGEEIYYSYSEIVDELIEYVKAHGFTHVELLPIMEHPLDASWGYQLTGYFSTTSRYGEPKDLMYFVDRCHQAGIGVILDWVPVHFCKDSHGLYMFDGTPQFEYDQEHDRENYQWGTANFNLHKPEVRSFLLSNIRYWLEKFHFDGIRVDAVSYLIYWHGNESGAVNTGAIDFMKRVNYMVHEHFQGVLMIAEDSSSYGKVTTPIDKGGLGFDLKWNLGWMNDSLKYMGRKAIHRQYHTGEITFSMFYNYSEQFVLPLSHDEVVHGKRTIVEKMSGNYEEQFRQARAYYAWMYAHPGKKLSFMGNEFGHLREWHEYRELDWLLLKYPTHIGFQNFFKNLGSYYRETPAFWQWDYHFRGFEWLMIRGEQSVFGFQRRTTKPEEHRVVLTNFSDQEFNGPMGVPNVKGYTEVFHSYREMENGVLQLPKTYTVRPEACDNYRQRIEVTIPPYTTIYLQPQL